jgi:hypothetical protein
MSTRTAGQQTGIYISHGGHDSVGQAVAYNLREQASKSSRYVVRPEATASYQIDLASVDVNSAIDKRQGEWSAVSVVFLARGTGETWIYLSQGIEVTGKSRAEETAQEILRFFDNILAQVASRPGT